MPSIPLHQFSIHESGLRSGSFDSFDFMISSKYASHRLIISANSSGGTFLSNCSLFFRASSHSSTGFVVSCSSSTGPAAQGEPHESSSKVESSFGSKVAVVVASSKVPNPSGSGVAAGEYCSSCRGRPKPSPTGGTSLVVTESVVSPSSVLSATSEVGVVGASSFVESPSDCPTGISPYVLGPQARSGSVADHVKPESWSEGWSHLSPGPVDQEGVARSASASSECCAEGEMTGDPQAADESPQALL